MNRKRIGVAGALAIATAALVTLLVQVQSDDPAPSARRPSQSKSDARVSVDLERPEVVVNRDGSATISATLINRLGDQVSLDAVNVRAGSKELPVLTTSMRIPIVPGSPATVGDAADAGGFIVPRGVAPGSRLELMFVFGDKTCLVTSARAVSRTSKHEGIFPKDEQGLVPQQDGEQPSRRGCSVI